MHHKPWWAWIAHFLGHTLVGTAVFVIVGTPAIGLSLLMEFLETLHVSTFTIQVLSFLEHGILLVDAMLFLVYLGVTAYQAMQEMIK